MPPPFLRRSPLNTMVYYEKFPQSIGCNFCRVNIWGGECTPQFHYILGIKNYRLQDKTSTLYYLLPGSLCYKIEVCYPKQKFYRSGVIKLLFDVSNFYNWFKTSNILKSPKNTEGGCPPPPQWAKITHFGSSRDS